MLNFNNIDKIFFIKYYKYLLLVYILIGIYILINYEITDDKIYTFLLTYITFPTYIIVILIFKKRYSFFKIVSNLSIILIFIPSYILLVNIYLGESKKIKIEGIITKLAISTHIRAATKYYVYVKNTKTNQIYRLSTFFLEYSWLKTGQKYYQYWNIGSLGIVYRKK
jgi:hypothetical protein